MKNLYSNNDFPDNYHSLEKIFNNTYNGIVILNLDGDWIKVNDRICDLFGYSRNEIFNMNIDNIIHREDLGVHIKKFDKLMAGDIDRYRVKQRYFHKEGYLVWVLISVSLISLHERGSSYMIWQFTDITIRNKNQDKLKKMLHLVRDQNERLTAFADIITHNLRSHVGNLATLSNFIEEDFTSIRLNENFMLLKTAIGNLEETVSHLTEVARVKKVNEDDMQVLNLYDYVDKAIYTIAAIAKNTNTSIINNVDEELCVMGIPAYLDSIILNFLTNAIKYRSDARLPEIKLSTSLEDDFVVLKIADNGLGIDMAKNGHKLFQIYNTFHGNKDAIGIGLFITKNHIESIGGKVKVKSEVGLGTHFFVYLKSHTNKDKTH